MVRSLPRRVTRVRAILYVWSLALETNDYVRDPQSPTLTWDSISVETLDTQRCIGSLSVREYVRTIYERT